MNQDAITSFDGPYRWLSNFWLTPIKYEGRHYPSSENAYQAAKLPNGFRVDFEYCTPGQSKRLGRACPLPNQWDERKVEIMRDILKLKFALGTALAEKLIATGDRLLVEGNTWNDTFWGVCKGEGENQLGKLLMEIREDLRRKF